MKGCSTDAPYGVSLHLLGNAVIKVCEMGNFFQLKVYERGTFPLKMVYKRLRGYTLDGATP